MERALEQAREARERAALGERMRVQGIPIQHGRTAAEVRGSLVFDQ